MIGLSENILEFIRGVDYIVEATSFERMTLWQTWHYDKDHTSHRKVSWKENTSGFLITVGHTGRRPTCMSVLTAIVDGKKILFYEVTSMLADHKKVENWFEKYLPDVPKVDAGNFHCAVNYKKKPQPADRTYPIDWVSQNRAGP